MNVNEINSELLTVCKRMAALMEKADLIVAGETVEGQFLLLLEDARTAIAKAENP